MTVPFFSSPRSAWPGTRPVCDPSRSLRPAHADVRTPLCCWGELPGQVTCSGAKKSDCLNKLLITSDFSFNRITVLVIDLQKPLNIIVKWWFSNVMSCQEINTLIWFSSKRRTQWSELFFLHFLVERKTMAGPYLSYVGVHCDPSKVGVCTDSERHRLQGPPAVPPKSEEPRHQRLPSCQAKISVGLAQLSPVSLLSQQVKWPHILQKLLSANLWSNIDYDPQRYKIKKTKLPSCSVRLCSTQTLPQHGRLQQLWPAGRRYWAQSGRGTQSQFLPGGHGLRPRIQAPLCLYVSHTGNETGCIWGTWWTAIGNLVPFLSVFVKTRHFSHSVTLIIKEECLEYAIKL